MNLKTAEFIFADCQSTGASPGNGNILEIAWCKTSALFEPQNIESYILQQPPDRPIPFIIQNITGIGEKELVDAIEPAVAYSSFTECFSTSEPAVQFAVIHYGRFEKSFLDHWHTTFAPTEELLPYTILCTHEIAKRIFPNLPTRGINGLAGFFGATIHDTKRSASHVHATWLIWRGLVDELSKIDIHTTTELKEWLSTVKAGKRGKLEYPIEKSKRTSLPNRPGVYRMYDRAGNILYVGKATSLKSRVNSYFRGRSGKDARRLEMLTRAYDLQVTECDTPLEAALLETDEIKRLNPPYNVVMKTGRRQLVYYNRTLEEWSMEKDLEHTIGPFSGPFFIDPLIRLSSSLKTGEFDPMIFFEYLEPDLLQQGFWIFVESMGLPDTCKTPRQFMAFALSQYKLMVKSACTSRSAGEPDESAVIELDEEDRLQEGSEEIDLTPEEVAGKFQRMFLRAAKAYIQAKALCALANSVVSFTDNGKCKTFRVDEGVVQNLQNTSLESIVVIRDVRELAFAGAVSERVDHDYRPETQIPLNENTGRRVTCSMDLLTFDRMRVFLSELGRVSSPETPVKIQYVGSVSVPSWILRRSLI